MKGSFNNIQNAVFDIPSFVVKGVRLSKGTNRYSIGKSNFSIFAQFFKIEYLHSVE